jgi:hypothetical protein
VSSSSLPATPTTIVSPDVGDGLAISSIVFCSGVAIAFILVRRRLMRGSADKAGLQNVGMSSRHSAGDLGSGIGGGLSWPGSRERLPLRM